MWPDRVSNSGPLTYESGALSNALRGPENVLQTSRVKRELLFEGPILQHTSPIISMIE